MPTHPIHRSEAVSRPVRIAALLIGLTGCRAAQTVHDPEYVPAESQPVVQTASAEMLTGALVPEAPEWNGPHPVEDYVLFALLQNPQIQAKRKRVEASAQRVPQAASLKDPTVTAMVFPFPKNALQTAGGRMQGNVYVSQEVPWIGKLRTQAEAAEAEVDMARAELAAAELEVIEQVKRAYYELYFVEQSQEITEESRALAVDLAKIAEAKYTAAQVSQQDLLRAELEVSNVDTELVRIRQELQSAQARLARLLHISPDTPVRAVDRLPAEELPRDLQALYAQALLARPELHALLAAVKRDHHLTNRARLDYFPDVSYQLGWGPMTANQALAPTADGRDNISIGMMANIPIYRRRLDAGVHEAEAKTVASVREYDNLRDRTEEEIKDLFAQATSQQQLLQLFEAEIIPKADQTLTVSVTAYESGEVDFLQVIDNWRQLLQYRLMQQRLEAQLRQSLAALERVVGGIKPASSTVVEPRPAPEAEADDDRKGIAVPGEPPINRDKEPQP